MYVLKYKQSLKEYSVLQCRIADNISILRGFNITETIGFRIVEQGDIYHRSQDSRTRRYLL